MFDLHLRTLAILSLTVLVGAGCATTTTVARGSAADVAEQEALQTALALRTYWNRQSRLQDLAWPLQQTNADMCGKDVAAQLGFHAISLSDLDKQFRPVAAERLGITERPLVLHVTQGSPADWAGLEVGDEFVSVAGETVRDGRNATRRLLYQIDLKEGEPTTFIVRRRGKEVTVEAIPEVVCRYPIALVQDDSLNAFADGNVIYITQGMYRFAQTDEELQLVIAHELAHNSEGHIDQKRGNALLGGLFDVVAAAYGVDTGGAFSNATAQLFSQEFEREADYVGMYMLARAGVETVEVADFWRKMAAEYPASIRGYYGSTHPASAERWTNIEATHDEIGRKLAAGAELLPQRKGQ
jgi:membrane-associated protease RseP (regulator of RpoE activity)